MATATVLLYSDDPQVRDRMRQAVGTRPAPRGTFGAEPGTVPDLTIEFAEAGTYDECVRMLDEYEVDLVVLDGEAAPAGGIGIARQLKDEIDNPPPTCLVIARAADRWLAAYARVDATLVHPLDPVTTGQTIAGLLRQRIGALGGAASKHSGV